MQACKPGSVSHLRETLIIYLVLTLPSETIGLPTSISGLTDKNGPFIFIEAYLTFQRVRFTMHPPLLLGRWALTPPFHYYLNPIESVRGYLFSVALSVNLLFPVRCPCFHKVRCPMLPGLSSLTLPLR